MNSTSKAINGKNKVAAAVSSQQGPINVSEPSSTSATTSTAQSVAPPKRLTGWARLKAGSEDSQQQQQQQLQQQHTKDMTESLQCNLDLLPTAKINAELNKARQSDYDKSISEMIENTKKTQAEVQKLTERVGKMEDIINDFVQKLNAALPVALASAAAAAAATASAVDDERHYTKRSKSKSRHHHRSSSSSGQPVSGNPAGATPPGAGAGAGAAASNPGTPSNSGNPVKISNNLKLSSKNEEFLWVSVKVPTAFWCMRFPGMPGMSGFYFSVFYRNGFQESYKFCNYYCREITAIYLPLMNLNYWFLMWLMPASIYLLSNHP